MSVQSLSSRDLFFSTLIIASLLALMASTAQAGTSRLGPSWGVDRIRSEAKEGDVVTLEGHVVSVSRSRLFTLEDISGEQILVAIPNHLLRETGKPKKGETIRVRGKYDHKTHLDVDKSQKSDPRKNWGIRVSAMDRNVSTSGRNPNPADAVPPSAPVPSARETPAAPMGAGSLGGPKLPAKLKSRLAAARKTALTAQDKLGNANTEFARGEYRNVEGAEWDLLSGSQNRAQQEYDEAIAAMLPLIEEARESGVDPKAIELYEVGLTKPRH